MSLHKIPASSVLIVLILDALSLAIPFVGRHCGSCGDCFDPTPKLCRGGWIPPHLPKAEANQNPSVPLFLAVLLEPPHCILEQETKASHVNTYITASTEQDNYHESLVVDRYAL